MAGWCKKALDGALTAPVTCPASETQHGDSSRHREHRTHNPTKLAQGRHPNLSGEAKEQW